MSPDAADDRAMLKPVRRQPLSDQVFERLCGAIVSGQFPPGSVLPGERKLCETLNVNRGAVREALKRLEQSRFISIRQGGATRVLDFWESARLDIVSHLLVTAEGGIDLKVARSMVELRAAITPDMVRLATLRNGTALEPALRPLLEEMRAHSQVPSRAQALNEQFWRIIVRGSENIAYVLVFNTMSEVNDRFKKLLTPFLAPSYQNVASFEAIAKAIVSGNVEDAQRATERHVTQIAAALASQIRGLQANGTTVWSPAE